MYKQIFNKTDGTPKLLEYPFDLEDEKKHFEYDETEFTEIQPPNGLYEPIHFDGEKWVGASKEEWLTNQSKEETNEVIPDEKDEVIANLSVQLLETQTTLETVQKDVANLTIQLLERD